MRKLAALAALVLLATIGAGSSSAVERRATMRLAALEPVTVKGLRFEPRERVRVTVRYADARSRKFVRASRAGRFTATFATMTADRCNSDLFARAVGDNGSRAAAKLPMRLCPPAL